VAVDPYAPLVVLERTRSSRATFYSYAIRILLYTGLTTGISLAPTRELVGAPIFMLGACILGIVAILAIDVPLQRWELARYARTEVYDDALIIMRPGRKHARIEVAFSEITSYSDASAEKIELGVDQPSVPRAYLAIPTPSEDGRTKLLELLDTKGIRRQD
jgi:hypothetical protein